jgi:hypothetical protein
VWDYPVEAEIFNPQLEKLDPKIISCHFISYPEKSKMYRFYYPKRTMKFTDTGHIMFLECDVSSSPREIDLEEIQTYVPPMTHVDFIPMTAPHVENTRLVENANSSAENLDVEHTIKENKGASLVKEQVGLEESEAPHANDHEEKPQ